MAAQKKKSAAKGKKKKARHAKAVARKKDTAHPKTKAPTSSPSWTAAVAERLTELVEYAATGALQRMLDKGGRELGQWFPEASEMRVEAGAYVRDLRGLAGLTIDELSDAVELSDHSILGAVEAGTATVSFELILRLAAILARHDPAPFVMRLLRSYNPMLWQLLEDWGVARLSLQGTREREFVNILRSSDEARALSDEDFDRVLDFTRSAFGTALHFAGESHEG